MEFRDRWSEETRVIGLERIHVVIFLQLHKTNGQVSQEQNPTALEKHIVSLASTMLLRVPATSSFHDAINEK